MVYIVSSWLEVKVKVAYTRLPLERYKDSPAGGGQRNDWIHQVAKEKEMDI